MNLVFAIYSNQAYREWRLPTIDDADYELKIDASEFGLRRDVCLRLEVMEQDWRIQYAGEYRVYSGDDSYEGKTLEPGLRLQIATAAGEKLVLLIWKAPEMLRAWKKYYLGNFQELTIGRSESSDIICVGQNAVSHTHAVLFRRAGKIFLRDTSRNGTYRNHQRLTGEPGKPAEVELQRGDLINIYGISFILLDGILAVNAAEGKIAVSGQKLKELSKQEVEERTWLTADSSDTGDINVHISPRVAPKLCDDVVTIENAPARKEGDKKPAWMSILPSFTMALPMILGYSLMRSGSMGVGIFIAVGSAVVGGTWAIINYRYAKKKLRADEMLRLDKYGRYLVETSDSIREKFEYNRNTLCEMHPSAEICSNYTAESPRLWAVRSSQKDFLFLRLGLGDMPNPMKINAQARGFSLIEDELADRPARIAESFKTMRDVPVGIGLTNHSVIGIVGDREERMRLVRVLLTQLAANHSCADVKLAFLYDEKGDCGAEWELARWIPHVWNEERSFRFIAANAEERSDLLYELVKVLRIRAETRDSSYSTKKTQILPHYVLIVENVDQLESQVITKYLYEEQQTLGITTVLLADSCDELPGECACVIENSQEFHGVRFMKEDGEECQPVEFDSLLPEALERLVKRMSSYRVQTVEYSTDIPTSLTFFDMMGIRRLKELHVVDRWRKNRTYDTMQALVGQRAGGAPCYLNIHEKFHGPHGLVAGTTGSGKSETLQTYILSLAINYSPLDVGFFLIDFKGGGMANLFANLPHTIGQISNLSGNQIRRAMVSIKSENRRRQRLFGEFGVNHIDAYTKLFKNHEATEPMPHLLIVIDEFAELKREEPEFMKELISVAQVGRSLGVHLILATQKPGGTVDDNIWSNTKFRLCLRVADRQDSNDMLHKPDAAYLTQAGRCYLQVGNDELYELFQSGWSGALYDANGEIPQASAVMIDRQGREALVGAHSKTEKRGIIQRKWIAELIRCIQKVNRELFVTDFESTMLTVNQNSMLTRVIILLNAHEERYPDTALNRRTLQEFLALLPSRNGDPEEMAEEIIELAARMGKKLPEPKEKTQLEAIVEYLADTAQKNGFSNPQMLWMPVLPVKICLDELPGYQENAYMNGWKDHRNEFSLSAVMGLVDDPENQVQFPLVIDLANKGHLAIIGTVTSGKSSFLQSLFYSLSTTYSPHEVVFYGIDFSSQMLCAFEGDAHVGGVVLEGEEDRMNKLFGFMMKELNRRKKQIRGGSFRQYVQVNGYEMPAIVLAIDGYANFREKTEGKFESNLIELSRDAESYGIYLVITCAGFGGVELQSKIADNMRQCICLELGDKYRYGEVMRTMHFDVLPEQNVKGRGLVSLDGTVLEYQTALACRAENDYERGEAIHARCKEMSDSWMGKWATPIPVIPEKPTWELLSATEEYQLLKKQKDCLPIGYYQEDASLYCIDLRKTYCYLIQGGEHLGKTTVLRCIGSAANDIGARVFFVDAADQGERKTAEALGAEYVSTPHELFEFVKTLISLTNERGAKRKQLRENGAEDDEIYQTMKAFQPVCVLIDSLEAFMTSIYTKLDEIGKLNAPIENIIAKGELLNVYFFAAMEPRQNSLMADKPAYRSFIRSRQGLLLGGEVNKQSIFQYQNIRFNEQARRFRPGKGYATSYEDDQQLDIVVLPQNKGRTPV